MILSHLQFIHRFVFSFTSKWCSPGEIRQSIILLITYRVYFPEFYSPTQRADSLQIPPVRHRRRWVGLSATNTITIIQDDRKVKLSIPNIYSTCKKNNLLLNRQKNSVTLSVGTVQRIQRCTHSLFSSCLLRPGEQFLCCANGSLHEILLMCVAQENPEKCP